MVEHCTKIKNQRKYKHRQQTGAENQRQSRLVQHRQYDFGRMKAYCCCYVKVPISVMDLVQRPQQRYFMGCNMLPVNRQIQQYQRQNELQPDRPVGPVEQANMMLGRIAGGGKRGDWPHQAQRCAIQQNDHHVGTPAPDTRHHALAARIYCFRNRQYCEQ